MDKYLLTIIWISIGGFFLGGVLFAKFFPRVLCGIDIEAVSEDGNPGTSNVFKYCSVPVGILTGICEFAKGFFPVLLGNILIPTEARTALFGLIICSVVLGHIFSVYHHGNGGMGAAALWATLMAVFLQCRLIVFLVAIYVIVRYICRVRQQHLRTILCFGIFLIATAVFETNMVYKPAYVFLSAVICAKCLYIAVRQKNTRAARLEN